MQSAKLNCLAVLSHVLLHYLQVNVLGVCMVTREFIKQLRERNVDDGHVILINRYSCVELNNKCNFM